MIKAKIFIETDDDMFPDNSSIEVELQFVPTKGCLFYLTEEHKNKIEEKMLMNCNQFREYYDEEMGKMYIDDVIYVYEVAMLSNGEIWISLAVDCRL